MTENDALRSTDDVREGVRTKLSSHPKDSTLWPVGMRELPQSR